MTEMPVLRGYAAFIAEILGTTDPAMCALVEEFMRMDRCGLDGLTLEQFTREALIAHHDVYALHEMGELESICRGYDIPVPDLPTAGR